MTFPGLFVGINKYRSPFISNLMCLARNTTALYALFADTFEEDDCILLVNEEATSSAIRSQFEHRLAVTHPDVVVISFSGHGSERHHLITHDTNPSDSEVTDIHLDELTHPFAKSNHMRLAQRLPSPCDGGGPGWE
jgi:helicase